MAGGGAFVGLPRCPAHSAEQLSELHALACGYGQGYLFAPPVAAEDMAAVLKDFSTQGRPASRDDPGDKLRPNSPTQRQIRAITGNSPDSITELPKF